MDLSSLYNTLSGPPDRLQQAENEMMERFKAAALSITHLYKSSVHTSKQAYRAGYSACLTDVLQTLQASLSTTSPMIDRLKSRDDFNVDLDSGFDSAIPLGRSSLSNMNEAGGGGGGEAGMRMHGEDGKGEGEGESTGKVLARLMDWLEARQEAIKLETEEEKEKEEAESSAAATGSTTNHPAGGKARRPPGPGRLDSMQMERPARPVSAPVIVGRGNQVATSTPRRTQPDMTVAKSGSMVEDLKTEDSEVEPEHDMSASITSLASTSSLRKKPSGGIKQRDALVQAVANARARDRSSTRGPEDGYEERSSSLAPVVITRPSSPVPINTATTPNLMAIRDTQPNPSSPLTPTPQAYASHHRPYKGFGHYRPGVDHRSKLLKRDRDRDRDSHSFNPNFGGTDLPLFPGSDSVGGEVDSDVVGSGPYGFASQGVGVHAGGKRAHENAFGGSVPVAALSLSNGHGHGHGHSNSVFGSAPVAALSTGTGFGSGGQGRGRRRGGHSGFAGFAMRGAGQLPGSEGEDDVIDGRERKRIARR